MAKSSGHGSSCTALSVEEQKAQWAACLELLAQAKVIVRYAWPYLTAAAANLYPVKSAHCPTVGVDKYWRLYINPEWWLKLGPYEAASVLAGHELRHLLFNHHSRLEYIADKQFVNIVNDLAINGLWEEFLTAAREYQKQVLGYTTESRLRIPNVEGMVFPKDFNLPDGLLSEEYAAKLLESGKVKMVATSCACGSGAGGMSFEDELPDPRSELDKDGTRKHPGLSEVEAAIQRAQTAEEMKQQNMKHPGTVPGGMLRWAEEFLAPPQVSWQQELKQALRFAINKASGAADYSHTKRANRQHDTFILPGLYKPQPILALVLDTSGSMQTVDYVTVLAEISGVTRAAGLPSVPVLLTDTVVNAKVQVRTGSKMPIHGGGGTDVGAGINAAIKLNPRPHIVIVLTDGYTPWPEKPPRGVKVIACISRPFMDGNYVPPAWVRAISLPLRTTTGE